MTKNRRISTEQNRNKSAPILVEFENNKTIRKDEKHPNSQIIGNYVNPY